MKFNLVSSSPTILDADLINFLHRLVIESLDVDQLIRDVKAVVENPRQHCPECVTTAAVQKEEQRKHTIYIEGTMILDIR